MTAGCLLAGCVSRPPSADSALELAVPETWTADSDGASRAEAWWVALGSPQLDALIREALESNRDLKAAAARLETAAAEARIAASDLYPGLRANLNASRGRQTFNLPGISGDGEPVGATNNTFGVSLESSWELDLWGRVRSLSSAALADYEAQAANYRAAAHSLAGQTAKSWFALAEAKQQLELARETVESYRETARQAMNRSEAGIQDPTDSLLTQANLASAEALLQQREETLRRIVRQLEILLGRYPAGILESTTSLPEVPALPAAGLPAELIARRPDLVAAERRLAGSIERVKASRASLYPNLSLSGSVGTSDSDLEDLFSPGTLMWNIAGNLVQPIFQGGALRARVTASAGREREALETFAQAVLDAFQEVETTLAVDQSLARREAAQRRAADHAGQARIIAMNRYAEGVDPLLVVLEAQRRELDARGAVIAVRRLRLENRIDLYLALGGGYEAVAIANSEDISK